LLIGGKMGLGKYLSKIKNYIKELFGFGESHHYNIDIKLTREGDVITLESFKMEISGKEYKIPNKYEGKRVDELPDADEVLEEMDKEREEGQEVELVYQGAMTEEALDTFNSELKKLSDNKRRWIYEDEKIYEAWKKKFRKVWNSLKVES